MSNDTVKVVNFINVAVIAEDAQKAAERIADPFTECPYEERTEACRIWRDKYFTHFARVMQNTFVIAR